MISKTNILPFKQATPETSSLADPDKVKRSKSDVFEKTESKISTHFKDSFNFKEFI